MLLAATDEAHAHHAVALEVVDRWPAARVTLYTSGQILREYLSVATRPMAQNGLGLPQADAVLNVRAFAARLIILAETAKVSEGLMDLLDEVSCTGKQVHDANVVATMVAHGIESLVTLNVRGFTRFGSRVFVMTPRSLPTEPPS